MTAMDRPLAVLVVERDPRLLDILTGHLARIGYAVRGAASGDEALALLAQAPSDVVVSEAQAAAGGRALLDLVRERLPGAKVVLMTGAGTVADAVEAMQAGAYFYLARPFQVEVLIAVLQNAARELALGAELSGLRQAVRRQWSSGRLVGSSPPMVAVRRAIDEAARIRSTVLLTGPTGTGKELAARAIHYEGPRAAGPFVPVSCAAVPQALFESSLFGHGRGAFTGAVAGEPGLLLRASGGTLLLDEVGEIPLGAQAKLLRVLDDGLVVPLGGGPAVPVDVRIIATAHQDLGERVRAGRFRADLFFRLDVVRIALPPLARRLQDLPELAEHLLAEVARELGVPSLGLTEAALERLARHSWPGNVRELKNVLERAQLRAVGRRVDAADLRLAAGGRDLVDAPRSLAEVERDHVEQVLASCRWNRAAAAQVLGIDARTLNGKIRRFGLVGPLRPAAVRAGGGKR
jgi:DNA-binding NtrC family response regulator